MITIHRSTLRRIARVAIAAAIILILIVLTLFVADRERSRRHYVYISDLWRGYIRADEAQLRKDELIGQQICVRDYLSSNGKLQTITACNPPQETFIHYGLSGIHLMDCTVDQCTMTCPLFAPKREAYELVGKLVYCPGSSEELCLADVSEIYLLKNAEEELRWMERKIPITPGPATFPIGQEWEQWEP